MAKKTHVHRPAFWDSAPSELERLTFYDRLEEKERIAQGWRRNILRGAWIGVVVLLAVLLRKVWR